MDIKVGDTVRLKKQHPCGSFEWEVLRSGADFRLKCKGCGHQVMVPRTKLEKSVREIKHKDPADIQHENKTCKFVNDVTPNL